MKAPAPPKSRPEPARDFRDQAIQEALDAVVERYEPEKRLRTRLARMAVIAVAALLAFAAFWAALHHSAPRPGPKAVERKAVPIQLLPPPKAP